MKFYLFILKCSSIWRGYEVSPVRKGDRPGRRNLLPPQQSQDEVKKMVITTREHMLGRISFAKRRDESNGKM
jgi:hypothetical protein